MHPALGKSTALRQIEASWCLPKSKEPGRRLQSWLPLDVTGCERDRAATMRPKYAHLNVHRRVYRLLNNRNWIWFFSSPILCLADDLKTDGDTQIPTWMHPFRSANGQSLGMILCCEHRAEAPKWFRTIFPHFTEARLRPLDLDVAKQMCTTSAQQEFVEHVFSSFCEPLNEYAQNRFLLSCMLESHQGLGSSSGLFDVLDAYIKARFRDLDPALVGSLLAQHLPKVAAALVRNETPTLPENMRNVGIALHLLADQELVHFEHPLLMDYFLAQYITRNWKQDPISLLAPLIGNETDMWSIRYLSLFRMVMKSLPSVARATFSEFLNGISPNLAHRCLLELSPSEYGTVGNSLAIRNSLVAVVEASTLDKDGDEVVDLETKIAAAESLAWYDPRISASGPVRNFVELQSVDRGKFVAAGRYPVTNLEYSEFIRAGGYSSEEVWTPAAWSWRVRHRITHPALWTIREFNRPNAPVVGVSFYEALAYARWFKLKNFLTTAEPTTPTVFSLPTSEEWAMAAGLDEKMGLEEPETLLSTRQAESLRSRGTGRMRIQMINAPSLTNLPVGLIPCEPTKVYDLVGNVWEWCDEWFGYSDVGAKRPSLQVDLRAPLPVLVRGGPITSQGGIAMTLFGSGMDPFSRMFNVGFRLFERGVGNNL